MSGGCRAVCQKDPTETNIQIQPKTFSFPTGCLMSFSKRCPDPSSCLCLLQWLVLQSLLFVYEQRAQWDQQSRLNLNMKYPVIVRTRFLTVIPSCPLLLAHVTKRTKYIKSPHHSTVESMWIRRYTGCRNRSMIVHCYLDRLPASTAHRHRSESLPQSLAPGRRREPRGRPCRRRGNHPRALSVTSFSMSWQESQHFSFFL